MPMPTKNETIVRILKGAADLLEANGWHKGKDKAARRSDGSWIDPISPKAVSFTIIGAIRNQAGYADYMCQISYPAIEAVAKYLQKKRVSLGKDRDGNDCPVMPWTLYLWNETKRRTKKQVVDVLRNAAADVKRRK